MSIREYLEDCGATVPNGAGWRYMRCPFHNDRTASASVNHTTNRFHCFTCGIHEDIIGLIMHRSGVGYVEARETAEARYGEGVAGVSEQSDTGDDLLSRSGNRRRNNSSIPARSGTGWRERI